MIVKDYGPFKILGNKRRFLCNGRLFNILTKEGATNKGNLYFLRVVWIKGGLVNTRPGIIKSQKYNRLSI